jgi:hypothetical protein
MTRLKAFSSEGQGSRFLRRKIMLMSVSMFSFCEYGDLRVGLVIGATFGK